MISTSPLFFPFRMLLLVAASTAKIVMVLIIALPMLVYDDDGVDVSVGVDVAAVVGVGINGQGVSPVVGTDVGLVVSHHPLTSLASWGARLRSGSLMTSNTLCPLDEVIPLINTLCTSYQPQIRLPSHHRSLPLGPFTTPKILPLR